MKWKGQGRKQSSPDLGNWPGICLGRQKNHEFLDYLCVGRDSRRAYSVKPPNTSFCRAPGHFPWSHRIQVLVELPGIFREATEYKFWSSSRAFFAKLPNTSFGRAPGIFHEPTEYKFWSSSRAFSVNLPNTSFGRAPGHFSWTYWIQVLVELPGIFRGPTGYKFWSSSRAFFVDLLDTSFGRAPGHFPWTHRIQVSVELPGIFRERTEYKLELLPPEPTLPVTVWRR